MDTTAGVVEITSVPKAGGTPQSARFYQGIFKVTQVGSITNLALTEPLASCRGGGRAAATTKKRKRHLWGDGKGSFRTSGTYSSATVRGTKWLVQDSCAGTLTRVVRGSVTVRDRVKRKRSSCARARATWRSPGAEPGQQRAETRARAENGAPQARPLDSKEVTAGPSLYRRHRPRTFADVVGQEHVVRTLRNAVEQGKVHHAYLFVGSRGTGKTSMAKILAACLNCEQRADGRALRALRVVRRDRQRDLAGRHRDGRGVEQLRRRHPRAARARAAYAPVSGRSKVYILDEAHMLSSQAWNAFLKTLEEPPPNTIFVLATTEAQKVLPTVVDRCHRFDFARPTVEQIASVIRRVAGRRGDRRSPPTPSCCSPATRPARSATRSARSSSSSPTRARPSPPTTCSPCSASPTSTCSSRRFDAVAAGDARAAWLAAARLADTGRDIAQFLKDLEAHARDLLVVQTLGEVPPELRLTPDRDERLEEQARRVPGSSLVRLLDLLAEALQAVKDGADARTQLELALVKAAAPEVDPAAARADGAGRAPRGRRSPATARRPRAAPRRRARRRRRRTPPAPAPPRPLAAVRDAAGSRRAPEPAPERRARRSRPRHRDRPRRRARPRRRPHALAGRPRRRARRQRPARRLPRRGAPGRGARQRARGRLRRARHASTARWPTAASTAPRSTTRCAAWPAARCAWSTSCASWRRTSARRAALRGRARGPPQDGVRRRGDRPRRPHDEPEGRPDAPAAEHAADAQAGPEDAAGHDGRAGAAQAREGRGVRGRRDGHRQDLRRPRRQVDHHRAGRHRPRRSRAAAGHGPRRGQRGAARRAGARSRSRLGGLAGGMDLGSLGLPGF